MNFMGKKDGNAAGVDQDLQAHIGRKLKASYEDVLNQPIPDRFLELLAQLETKEVGGATHPSETDDKDAR